MKASLLGAGCGGESSCAVVTLLRILSLALQHNTPPHTEGCRVSRPGRRGRLGRVGDYCAEGSGDARRGAATQQPACLPA